MLEDGSSRLEVFCKKDVLNISQNSHENISIGVGVSPWSLLNFWKHFFDRILLAAASVMELIENGVLSTTL